MKIRLGFVSNSSSSSFCLIGTGDKKALKEVLNESNIEKPEEISEGQWKLKNLILIANSYDVNDSFFVGLEAEDLLVSKNLKYTEAVTAFLSELKEKHGIDLGVEDVEFSYGEVSN